MQRKQTNIVLQGMLMIVKSYPQSTRFQRLKLPRCAHRSPKSKRPRVHFVPSWRQFKALMMLRQTSQFIELQFRGSLPQ